MPHFCAAYGCSNERSFKTRARGITFHSFPQNAEKRRQWELALRRDGFVASKNCKLCSEHFRSEDFDRTGQTVRLKAGVVPTIFNFLARLQRPVATRSTAASRRAEENLPMDLHQDEPPPDKKMYCPFCGHKLRCASTFCGLCGKNIKFLYEFVKHGTREGNTGKNVLSTFQESQALKKEKKLSLKKKKELVNTKLVKIYVGMMTTKDGELKAVRGMVLPLAVHPRVDAEELCKAAELKMRDFDKNLQGGPFFLLYPDGTKIVNIPGTDRPFTLQAYKDALGKAYQRITVYICTVEDFYSQDISTDSSDSEAALSNTADAPGTSRGTMDSACSRCPDNEHQTAPTSVSPRRSVNPFGFNEADLQLLPTDKENVKTIKKEESPSPHQEDLKPPHIIKKEEIELAIPHLDPDLYSPPLTNIKTEESSDTDDSEDWK